MTYYDIAYIVDPRSQDPASLESDITRHVTACGGVVHGLENWGVTVLAYPVNGATRAVRCQAGIECHSRALSSIRRTLAHSALRHLVMKRRRNITDALLLALRAGAEGNSPRRRK
ncbi:putative 30S ribosomal protein S6 [Candidatus Tremblaya princeps PCIT]|uniref:Small ribosomal subunit protein bS6 n=1 Tax=Tremblaya princeps (strain PCIT) TaxID=891398 RepID=F7XYF3_TREPP|nr:putative 30S ribosomal protein S6 [Candidatus Tremblaya princeps PCIT]AEK38413.1 30S ribosomal protein S6 [Candidatus Tremblaya princeps PCVAL]